VEVVFFVVLGVELVFFDVLVLELDWCVVFECVVVVGWGVVVVE
jgi:hypothetical protein